MGCTSVQVEHRRGEGGTQIVTHLCYSEFEDILEAIDNMDADVLRIENSRSWDAMLKTLAEYGYARDIGPGVYDIHSPVVPEVEIMQQRVKLFQESGALSEVVIKREEVNVSESVMEYGTQ